MTYHQYLKHQVIKAKMAAKRRGGKLAEAVKMLERALRLLSVGKMDEAAVLEGKALQIMLGGES